MARSYARRIFVAMSKTLIPLGGRVVAITGAARGLGLSTAQALAARGARVAIADLDGDLARVEAAALPGPGPHAGFEADVTDPNAFAAFLDETERHLGPIDVLVNNAGIMPVGPFAQEDPSVTRRQVEINVLGVMTGTRLALDRMLPRRRGHIVNLASAAGRVAVPGEAVYTATKHAVVGFGEALRAELRDTGVEVTTVMPSLAATELAAGMRPPRFVPMVKPEQVAAAIAGALERPRLEVMVPSWITPLVRVQLAGSSRFRDFLRRLFRVEEVGGEIDYGARAAYVERYERPVAADEHELAHD
jgi:NAD(P)-dependent dehydrogenase (short-subunit alcohol dehydrogenase family)